MISLIALLALASSQPVNSRSSAGDWYVADDTDNNTGERDVYAFQIHLKGGDPDFVKVTMRCTSGKPAIFVEWEDVSLPDQAVLTFRPVATAGAPPAERQYVFQESKDPVESGLRASAEASAEIVASIGDAKYATITAHLVPSPRTITMGVNGTAQAWSRVSRNCPKRIMPRPPE